MQTKDREFYKQLFVLVLPIAAQNLMSSLVSASDTLMLGMLNQESLSAISLATQVVFVLSLFYAAFTIGASVLAAQYWGKEDTKSVEWVLAIALRLSMLVSVVFFLAANLKPDLLMRIFTNDGELIALGIPYLRIVSWSYLCMGISQVYLCIMKNSGRTLRSTVYGSVALVGNILLNAILIFGLFGFPKFGVAGAAYATTIARIAELVLVLLENRRKDVVRIHWKRLISRENPIAKDFYHYTAPVMANELVWGCGFTMFSAILGYLGSNAVAANSIANIVKNIIACVCLGIGTGSGILIGNELGRGNLEEAKRYGGKLCRLSILTGVISGGFILLCSPLILRFSDNLTTQAAAYLQYMLIICSYYMIGKSVNGTVIAGIFCAGGDTKFGFNCDTITMWVVIVPSGLIAAFVLDLPVMAVYILLNLDEIIKLPAVYRHYKKYQWLNKLTKGEIKNGSL